MNTQKHFTRQQGSDNGYTMLLAVLITTAVGAGIAGTVLLSGLGTSRSGLVTQQSMQARSLGNACAEEALQKLRESLYYSGDEILTFSAGSCQILPISGTGNTNRTVETTGSVGTVIRKVRIVIAQVHPTISLSSWLEVGDF
ncbi:MAG TPA: hypothetical protein VJB93_03295 [Patescibacteria group bacterium]|nr:hypothetical protein [Patescibacteria group bacterium]